MYSVQCTHAWHRLLIETGRIPQRLVVSGLLLLWLRDETRSSTCTRMCVEMGNWAASLWELKERIECILNDSASDPYRPKSNADTKEWPPTFVLLPRRWCWHWISRCRSPIFWLELGVGDAEIASLRFWFLSFTTSTNSQHYWTCEDLFVTRFALMYPRMSLKSVCCMSCHKYFRFGSSSNSHACS